jgi:acetate---CoA ligase (ADP-forming)
MPVNQKNLRIDRLDLFLNPRSVAIIGASRKSGPGSFNLIENMRAFGYTGKIFPVNPQADEILGLKAYKDIRDIPEAIDIAILNTPREHIPRIIEDCAAMGIPGVIVVPQGFADADEEGHRLQQQLTQLARDKGIRIMGPNTLGVQDSFSGFTSSFMPLVRETAPVGVICQSGIFFVGAALFSGLLGKGIDLANTSDLDFADALDYFGDDEQIRVIFAHVEGLKDGRRFLETAQRVSRLKPIITLKTGKSLQGGRAAASHSGSMVGDYQVFEAAMEKAGVTAARDSEEVLDITRAFLNLPLLKGKRIGVITFTGAGGIILIDALLDAGLEPADPAPATINRIKDLSPPWMPLGNPLDIWPALMKNGLEFTYKTALEGMLADPGVDGVVCIATAPFLPDHSFLDASTVIMETTAAFPDKPVMVWLYGPNQPAFNERFNRSGNILALPTLPRVAKALAALHKRFQFLNQEFTFPEKSPVRPEAERFLAQADKESGKLGDPAALALMKRCGIPLVEHRLVKDLAEALEAASAIGYPVALKTASPKIVHKTEMGGVVLALKGPDELKEAISELESRIRKQVPGAEKDGFVLQRMASGGLEVLLGAKRDPQFGPVIIFGTGGIYTELWKDIAYGLCPISREEAGLMIRKTRAYEIIKGFRGREPLDETLLVEMLLRLSRLMEEVPEIREMEINPFVVFPQGGAALDSRVIIAS